MFYRALARRIPVPNRVLVISAHWEEDVFKVTSSPTNFLSYDYFGYAPRLYDLNYTPPGDVKFAKKVKTLSLQLRRNAVRVVFSRFLFCSCLLCM